MKGFHPPFGDENTVPKVAEQELVGFQKILRDVFAYFHISHEDTKSFPFVSPSARAGVKEFQNSLEWEARHFSKRRCSSRCTSQRNGGKTGVMSNTARKTRDGYTRI